MCGREVRASASRERINIAQDVDCAAWLAWVGVKRVRRVQRDVAVVKTVGRGIGMSNLRSAGGKGDGDDDDDDVGSIKDWRCVCIAGRCSAGSVDGTSNWRRVTTCLKIRLRDRKDSPIRDAISRIESGL